MWFFKQEDGLCITENDDATVLTCDTYIFYFKEIFDLQNLNQEWLDDNFNSSLEELGYKLTLIQDVDYQYIQIYSEKTQSFKRMIVESIDQIDDFQHVGCCWLFTKYN